MLRLTFAPEEGDAPLAAAQEDAHPLLERVRVLEALVEQLAAQPAEAPSPPEVTIARHADLTEAEAAGALRRVWLG
ncbi:MAG: hypothetical protein J0H67_13665 [Rhodospirillales bacterium]|nr:hypothetical protein [Rhodospirillales bacterium]MBN8898502.1 hypothetical protein [Rhodospirillales bacterium]